MFDRIAIYRRFASCYEVDKPAKLARLLGVVEQVVYDWESGKRMVPRVRLKKVVDEKGLYWHWLLEGKGDRCRLNCADESGVPLNRHDINQRFLDLFPGVSQAKLGKLFAINQTTVFKWRHDILPVPWSKLKYAVDNKAVTWDWLLEGRWHAGD